MTIPELISRIRTVIDDPNYSLGENIQEMKEEFNHICTITASTPSIETTTTSATASPTTTTSPVEIKIKPDDPLMKMLINFVKDHLKDDSNVFQWKEFYDPYVALIGNSWRKMNPRAFSVNLQKILDKKPLPEPITKHDKRGRGIEMTIPELMDRIRIVMKDPNYSFEEKTQ